MTPRLVYTDSASDHEVADEDILWAMTHPIITEPVKDQLHPERKATRYIGMAKPPSTIRLEVVASVDLEREVLVIFHAMPMRAKFQHLIDEQWRKQ
jgi:hypothetical protein